MKEALNIAGQCRATASHDLACNIVVDGGSGLLRELLIDAAMVIETLAQQEPAAHLPCPTCEALARTVMLDQTSHDNFKQRILELEALLERQTALLEHQTARIVELQEHIENFEGEDR